MAAAAPPSWTMTPWRPLIILVIDFQNELAWVALLNENMLYRNELTGNLNNNLMKSFQ